MTSPLPANDISEVLAQRLVLLGASLTHSLITGDLEDCGPLLQEREIVLCQLTNQTLSDAALSLLSEAVEQEREFQELLGRHLAAIQTELSESFRDRVAMQRYPCQTGVAPSVGRVA